MIATVLSAVVICLSLPAHAEKSIVAKVTESFEINGRLFPASVVKVSEVMKYTPVTTINEIWVGNECLGLFMTRESTAAPIASRHELIFSRMTDGHLVLEGLAMRGEPVRELVDYDEVTRRDESDSPTLEARTVSAAPASGAR